MLSKSLIQFSVDGWGCVPSLFFDLRPNHGGNNEDNGNLLQKYWCMHCCVQCPRPCSRHCGRLLDTQRQVWLSLLWGHCSFLLAPSVHKVLFVPSNSPQFPLSCGSSVIKSYWLLKSNSLGVLSPFVRSPGWEILNVS